MEEIEVLTEKKEGEAAEEGAEKSKGKEEPKTEKEDLPAGKAGKKEKK